MGQPWSSEMPEKFQAPLPAGGARSAPVPSKPWERPIPRAVQKKPALEAVKPSEDSFLNEVDLPKHIQDLDQGEVDAQEAGLRESNIEGITKEIGIVKNRKDLSPEKKREMIDLLDKELQKVKGPKGFKSGMTPEEAKTSIASLKNAFGVVGEFLPGLGEIASARDAVEGFEEGDPWKAALGTLGAVPGAAGLAKAVGLLGIIGGASRLGMTDILKADELRKAGVPNSEIFDKTGIFFGKFDEKPRALLSDKQSSLKKQNLKREGEFIGVEKGEVLNLTDVLDHPQLFKIYPELKGIKVVKSPNVGGGGFGTLSDGTQFIRLGDNSNSYELLKTVLHEVQHAVQRVEGFTGGGSPKDFIAHSKLLDQAYNDSLSLKQKLIRDVATSGFDPWEFKPSFLGKPARRSLSEISDPVVRSKMENILDIDNYLGEIDKVRYEASQSYMKIAGEAEARAVEAMLDQSEKVFPMKELLTGVSEADLIDSVVSKGTK